jgi:hypothetical protein
LRQLQREGEVAAAVLANPYTRICFRVGDDDARKLADGFAFFERSDLQNLSIGQAICRAERSDFDFNLTVPLFPDPAESEATERRQAVVAASRRAYGTPRAEVERMLYQSVETDEVKPPAKPPPGSGKESPRPTAPVPAKPAESAERVAGAKAPEPMAEPVDERLQEEIKQRIGREAESLDYAVTFEEPVLSGAGRIDVVLRRGERFVACEICVRNALDYEVGNVRKCLEAGFRQVVVVCPNRTKLGHVQEAIAAALPAEQASMVTCQLPDEFLRKLFDWAGDDPEGGAAERGKRRKQQITLDGGGLGEEERRQQEKSMLQKLAEAMKRKRER